jgi:hypothetical protein
VPSARADLLRDETGAATQPTSVVTGCLAVHLLMVDALRLLLNQIASQQLHVVHVLLLMRS